MDKVNVQSLGSRSRAKMHCDRLYDVLLAKAYRRHYSRQDEYPITLAVDCDNRGLVTDIRIAERGKESAS